MRRTTDIPLFYGKKSKDQPQQYIEGLEKAARVTAWLDDQRRCDEFTLSLRENALSWYNTLDNIIGFNKNNWNDLKEKFLEAYAPNPLRVSASASRTSSRRTTRPFRISTTGFLIPSGMRIRPNPTIPLPTWAPCTTGSPRPMQTRSCY
jgi:hypothetical protein